MSMLASLVRAYERLPDKVPFGYSVEKIGFCIVLDAAGFVPEVIDLRADDRKRNPRMLPVPQAVKRTAGIAPNFLWDKSAYVLGVTAGEGKRTAEEHARFREWHLAALEGATDEGLIALKVFLTNWSPDAFAQPLWPEDLRDQNLVFRLQGEKGFLHDRPAARDLWARLALQGASAPQICLVTGKAGPIARLHPSVKGVWDAQSSGASLVSFNRDAFTSYGHDQGDNAPVSEVAAFSYGTALNHFLQKDSGHRFQIGDASTVFWADARDAEAASQAEAFFAAFFDAGAAERIAALRVGDQLRAIRAGRPLSQIAPELDQGVRFSVLALSPNAARLSVRFWW